VSGFGSGSGSGLRLRRGHFAAFRYLSSHLFISLSFRSYLISAKGEFALLLGVGGP
jgi:hypothetical protein